jgi:hypothetical protein
MEMAGSTEFVTVTATTQRLMQDRIHNILYNLLYLYIEMRIPSDTLDCLILRGHCVTTGRHVARAPEKRVAANVNIYLCTPQSCMCERK